MRSSYRQDISAIGRKLLGSCLVLTPSLTRLTKGVPSSAKFRDIEALDLTFSSNSFASLPLSVVYLGSEYHQIAISSFS